VVAELLILPFLAIGLQSGMMSVASLGLPVNQCPLSGVTIGIALLCGVLWMRAMLFAIASVWHGPRWFPPDWPGQ